MTAGVVSPFLGLLNNRTQHDFHHLGWSTAKILRHLGPRHAKRVSGTPGLRRNWVDVLLSTRK